MFLKDLILPIPSDLPSLGSVYRKLRDIHTDYVEYVIDGAALTQFEKYHDSLVTRQGRQMRTSREYSQRHVASLQGQYDPFCS